MDKEKYIALYEKFLAGQCTAHDEELLHKYQDNFEFKEHTWEEGMGNRDEIKEDIYNRLNGNMHSRKRSGMSAILKWSAAASITVAVLFGFYKMRQPEGENIVKQKAPAVHQIKPGGNKATLTLADGSVITLDNSTRGLVTNHDGVDVQQIENGQLVYRITGNNNDSAPVINTISTPLGGQYQVVLQDGTKVWLNAASSLRFPTVFSGNNRIVEITGEAYFEVAKNPAKPFKVNFNGNTITVLGTHFNVMAYGDETKSKVTLVEGAVKLANTTGNTQLTPGMQAIIRNNNSTIYTRTANIEEAIAWKKGYFLFENENIESIMRKISRWYDVDIAYDGNMRGKEFTGGISRFKNVNEVLDMLELTESIRFKVEGRRIKVMP